MLTGLYMLQQVCCTPTQCQLNARKCCFAAGLIMWRATTRPEYRHWSVPTLHWDTNSPLHIAARMLCPGKTLTEHMPTLVCHWSDNLGKPPHDQNTDMHWSAAMSHWDMNSPSRVGTRILYPQHNVDRTHANAGLRLLG